MIVAKFGGGILSSKEDYIKVAKVLEDRDIKIAVVSAVNGVTDKLIELIEKALSGNDFQKELIELENKHTALSNGKEEGVKEVFEQIKKILIGINYTKEISPRLRASVLSRGEYLSALILQSHAPSFKFNPAEKLGLIAHGDYLNARCDFTKSSIRNKEKIITTGFYAPNGAGEICLFGRGGSDYSAGVIAKLVKAKKLEFWKNVDGFLTADPRIVKEARKIEEMSFDEAAEICRFGAKILHPSALEPLYGTGTVVETKNILKPDQKGTLMYEKCTKNKIASIAGKKDVSIVSVSGNEMVQAFGIAAKILSMIANAGITVDAIATAQANISFTIEKKEGKKAIAALADLDSFKISLKEDCALIGIVGEGVKNDSSFLSNVFFVLAKKEIRTQMVSQGASESDISLIIEQKNYENAIKAIHKKFVS